MDNIQLLRYNFTLYKEPFKINYTSLPFSNTFTAVTAEIRSQYSIQLKNCMVKMTDQDYSKGFKR